MKLFLTFLVLLLAAAAAITLPDFTAKSGTLRAGVAKVNATLPLGVPLAGYNHGARRVEFWPIPDILPYSNFMTGNIGHIEPIWVKAMVVDDGNEKIAFVTMDGIGADGNLIDMAWNMATDDGFTVPFSNVIMSASHTHSGPGAISPEFLWAMAPATDLMIPELQRMFAGYIAEAMVKAESNLQDAMLGITVANLTGVTRNRRARISKYVNVDTIDPNLAVIRVDDMQGGVIGTVWNFAIHGTCYGPSNMKLYGDIMGHTNTLIEQNIGGVSFFINADAGDIDPTSAACAQAPNFAGSTTIMNKVVQVRKSIKTSSNVALQAYSENVPFGSTDLNFTLARFENCTSGGELDICTICRVLGCDINAHMGDAWLENKPKFTAFKIVVDSVSTVVVTVPGEALIELGWQIRNDTQKLGFDQTLFAGYSNSHMGYFATPDEYDIGGYESQLTFWGIKTSSMIRNGAYKVAAKLAQAVP